MQIPKREKKNNGGEVGERREWNPEGCTPHEENEKENQFLK